MRKTRRGWDEILRRPPLVANSSGLRRPPPVIPDSLLTGLNLIGNFLFNLPFNRKQKPETVLKPLPQHQDKHQAHTQVESQRQPAQQVQPVFIPVSLPFDEFLVDHCQDH